MINEQIEQAEQVTEPLNLVYPIQAEHNIKIVLSSERITEDKRVLFIQSLNFLMNGEFNQMNGKPKVKPSINRIYAISGLSKTLNNRVRLSRLLSYFKASGNIKIDTGTSIKPSWRRLSNGVLCMSRNSEQVRYIAEVKI